jgi:nucleoside 2-deoxyribosyltransferase
MQIYLTHATCFNYQEELYKPLQHLVLPQAKLILPHLNHTQAINSQHIITQSDLVIAEVSFASTGMGIELGWASLLNKPIYCVHRYNTQYSSSIKVITQQIMAYEGSAQLAQGLTAIYQEIGNKLISNNLQ